MEYREHDNVIYRGEMDPRKGPRMHEKLVGGAWVKCQAGSGLKANTFGAVMTEAEAKEFQGEGWPADEQSPAAAPKTAQS